MRRLNLAVDCADPYAMVEFWCAALGYEPLPPPGGAADWLEYWRSIGVPEEELEGADGRPETIVDPAGTGPKIWFQKVPEPKTVKNRLHFDVTVSGGREVPLEERRRRVDAEADRLVGLGATRLTAPFDFEGVDHYFVQMLDPEGNEFDVA